MVFFYLHRGKYQLIEARKRWYLLPGLVMYVSCMT